ncbi:TetR/AcrR family transcriptional regulator [Streptomyces sp. N35]|uniref:TetR/AcrR family transcriptional regulator n=1 Tax=Streptomyces sp. N35 TaxID=2795730 RepID=UPI0018F64843|nr:TetR/AcrR family transcriptional regulator [Streptomyces sp. N35]
MSPKQQRGAATVDHLLTCALRVYAEHGQEGFTVGAVTSASGVSLGSLYHHFGSFGGLAAALYCRCMAQVCDEMIDALYRTRTTRTGIQALVRSYLRFIQEHRDAALFLHASSYSGHLATHAAEIRALKDEKFGRIAAWMAPRIEAGEIAPLPEPLLEILVLGPVIETARRSLTHTFAELDLDEAVRELPDRIWRSVRP